MPAPGPVAACAPGVDPSEPRPDLRAARRNDTEHRILMAAAALFVQQGWAATTLAGVARAAGVADRTVYVRFGTKAQLFKRAVDVAIVGDNEPVDLSGRDTWRLTMSAPTLAERVSRLADGAGSLMSRLGPLIEVAQQAAGEPLIAASAQAGREATAGQLRAFWAGVQGDGLLADTLGPEPDLETIIATSTLLVAVESYILMRWIQQWDVAAYQVWLRTALWQLATARPIPVRW